MATFEYVSARGDRLALSNAENYYLVNIDGQTTGATSISSTIIGGADGDEVQNVQAQPRTIIFDLRITAEVEQTTRKILNVIKLKQKGTLLWTQNGRTWRIEGVVESIDSPRWENGVVLQVTLHCENPYWEDIEQVVTEIKDAIALHYFTDIHNDMLIFTDEGIVLGEYDTTRTKDFHNAGDVAVGMEIEIVAYRTVTNPIIYNAKNEFFGCGYNTANKTLTMNAGDVLKINTKKNEKSVTLNGVSILSKVKPRSTWLQLEAGDNTFSVSSDDVGVDNMTFSVKYTQRYI